MLFFAFQEFRIDCFGVIYYYEREGIIFLP